METFIALFRGINVGGRNILPMKELVKVLAGLDFQFIKTFIQSGNVVFQSRESDKQKLTKRIIQAMEAPIGFKPQVMLLFLQELKEAIERNPFPEGDGNPKSLHLFFLASGIEHPNLESLEAIRAGSEKYQLVRCVFYLYAPDGIGRSKLAANVEKRLGIGVTARNWRTVRKVYHMAWDISKLA